MAENEKLMEVFFDGQKAIFAELKSIGDKIGAIPLHGQEINHLKSAIADIKVHCTNQHAKPPTGLLKQIGSDLARATALLLFAILAFTLFNNTQAYFNQQHTINVTEEKKK